MIGSLRAGLNIRPTALYQAVKFYLVSYIQISKQFNVLIGKFRFSVTGKTKFVVFLEV